MTRYVTLPATAECWETRASDSLARTVHEQEPDGPRKTGLVDARGTPIFVIADRKPIGFVHFGDKS